MLDRFLVIAEKQGLPALIVANKVDWQRWSGHANGSIITYRWGTR